MNTKHISLALATIAVAALLAGCAKNPMEEPGNAGGLTDLELSHVGSTEVKSAIDGTDFPQTGEIGLFLFTDEAATTAYGDGYANIQYSYNSDKKKWTATPSIKVGSTPGYLYGYYPYDSKSTDIKAIPVESSLNGDDVMYASKQAEPITDATAANTAITMNHALARVSITIVNKGYTGDAKLTKIKFYGAEIAPTGTLNAIDGKITAEKDEVSLDVTGDAQTITAAGSTYECLLVPSDDISSRQDVTITFMIDEIAKEATLSGDDNGVIFAQGTKSNIAITLSDKGISVQTVSVEDWQTVQVGGHKVTVKFNDEVIPHDVLTDVYAEGNTAKIEAFSKSGITLGCIIAGDAQCLKTKSDNIYTFTISNISSDITATIGYPHVSGVTLDRMSVSPAKGWIVNLKATIAPEDAANKNVSWSSNNTSVAVVDANGNVTTISKGTANITVTTQDGGKTAQCVVTVGEAIEGSLPNEFSVSNTKKVHFSKGNLWYGKVGDASEATFNFEDNQYDTTPSSDGGRVENHISHFIWCDNATNAMALKYDSGWDGLDKTFFAAKNFTVNGYSGWSVLTGDSNEEWSFLLNSRNTAYGSNRRYAAVKVNGMAGLLLFPDNFSSWPSKNAGTEPQTFNASSSNWNDRDYTIEQFNTLQNNGCVFLPAAGSRNGNPGRPTPASVLNVGSTGYYWSASPDTTVDNALNLYFDGGFVIPDHFDARFWAQSVRLVTECQSEPSAE